MKKKCLKLIDFRQLQKNAKSKWGRIQEGGISLTTADLDFYPPPEVLDYVQKELSEGRTTYGDVRGDQDILDVICEKLRQKNKIKNIHSGHISFVPGASFGIYLVSQAALRPKDEALIIPGPVHASFFRNVELAGGRVKFTPIDQKNFRLDKDRIRKSITRRTKLLMICNPHNPCGMNYQREELEFIGTLAKKNKLIVLSDEIYEDLVHEGEHISMASLDEEVAQRTLTIQSVSKSFNLAGLRGAYIFSNGPMMNELKPRIAAMLVHTDRAAQLATGAAILYGQDWLAELKEHVREMRDLSVTAMNHIPGIECHIPEATPFIFPNIKSFGMKSVDFAKYLYDTCQVAVLPGSDFGPLGEGHIRINLATSEAILEEAFFRIKNALNKL